MNYDDIVSNLMQELRRGTLIIAVLSQLKKEEYGYNLITKLKENGITVEANTLYPLLSKCFARQFPRNPSAPVTTAVFISYLFSSIVKLQSLSFK